MGLASQPVGELEYKVNDGRYHVLRFTRRGQNSSVQLDDRPPHFKHPHGQCSHHRHHHQSKYLEWPKYKVHFKDHYESGKNNSQTAL